jgi:hypothetical protein
MFEPLRNSSHLSVGEIVFHFDIGVATMHKIKTAYLKMDKI